MQSWEMMMTMEKRVKMEDPMESLLSDYFTFTNNPYSSFLDYGGAGIEADKESCGGAPPPKEEDLSKPTIHDHDHHHKTHKHLKPKKGNEKNREEKEERYAFMTKSEVEHLEDGYKWRKYGQKAVKKSPFPRSYYRCTSASCNVKKRVERCLNDPTLVVTTYEGHHTHSTPYTIPTQPQTLSQQHQQLQFNNFTVPFITNSSSSSNTSNLTERRFCTTPPAVFLRDDGLLQDILPSTLTNDDYY